MSRRRFGGTNCLHHQSDDNTIEYKGFVYKVQSNLFPINLPCYYVHEDGKCAVDHK